MAVVHRVTKIQIPLNYYTTINIKNAHIWYISPSISVLFDFFHRCFIVLYIQVFCFSWNVLSFGRAYSPPSVYVSGHCHPPCIHLASTIHLTQKRSTLHNRMLLPVFVKLMAPKLRVQSFSHKRKILTSPRDVSTLATTLSVLLPRCFIFQPKVFIMRIQNYFSHQNSCCTIVYVSYLEVLIDGYKHLPVMRKTQI